MYWNRAGSGRIIASLAQLTLRSKGLTRGPLGARVICNCAPGSAVIIRFTLLRAARAACGEPAAGRRADTPMPLRESEAIVLQSYPLGEADRLVSFLSRTMGRVRGVAPGARRPKSRFGSTLERLSHIRIWFFERETRELVRINQCELMESFLEAHGDYDASVAFALFSEITDAVLPDREPNDAAFRLLLLSAQAVKRTGQVALPLAYFGLWTVRLGGWLPDLDRCARCGRELGAAPGYVLLGQAGLVCAKCRLPGARVLSGVARAAARRMIAGKLDLLMNEPGLDAGVRELSHFLLDLIEHHMEKKLTSRTMLEPTL
jgi:DNA repair protein RecO (recombination protein O)